MIFMITTICSSLLFVFASCLSVSAALTVLVCSPFLLGIWVKCWGSRQFPNSLYFIDVCILPNLVGLRPCLGTSRSYQYLSDYSWMEGTGSSSIFQGFDNHYWRLRTNNNNKPLYPLFKGNMQVEGELAARCVVFLAALHCVSIYMNLL